MKVITYEPNNSIAERDINYLCEIALTDRNNKYPENYKLERMKDEYVCVTIGYGDDGSTNDKPFTMSFVHKRDIFNGMVRILSRFYIFVDDNRRIGLRNPTLPVGGSFVRPSTIQMVNQQVRFCDSLGYNDQFFSRKEKINRLMVRFTKGLNTTCEKTDWVTDRENTYWVCDGCRDDCAQYIAWRGKLCLTKS